MYGESIGLVFSLIEGSGKRLKLLTPLFLISSITFNNTSTSCRSLLFFFCYRTLRKKGNIRREQPLFRQQSAWDGTQLLVAGGEVTNVLARQAGRQRKWIKSAFDVSNEKSTNQLISILKAYNFTSWLNCFILFSEEKEESIGVWPFYLAAARDEKTRSQSNE